MLLCNQKFLFWIVTQRAQAALQAVSAVQSGNLALPGALTNEGTVLPGQSPVLRIIIENLFYPVTLEVLHQVRMNTLKSLHC